MLLGASADRTQPRQHVFSIYQRMHHCTGLCILTVKNMKGYGGGVEGVCLTLLVFSNNIMFLWPHSELPERRKSHRASLHLPAPFRNDTLEHARSGNRPFAKSQRGADSDTILAVVSVLPPRGHPVAARLLKNDRGSRKWQC